jgi:hypothetical protein
LTDEFKEEQKANDQAVTYLVLSCTDKAFNTVTNARVYENAYEMWESLRKNFEADDDDDVLSLIAEFVESRLLSNKEDPEEWISRMEVTSQEMAVLDKKYEKSDKEIVAQTFAHLPKMYESTVEALCNNGKSNTLEQMKKGLTMRWKALYGKNIESKAKSEDGAKEALNVELKNKSRLVCPKSRERGEPKVREYYVE